MKRGNFHIIEENQKFPLRSESKLLVLSFEWVFFYFLFQIFETVHTGVTTNRTCDICFELYHAAKVAMKHMKKRNLLVIGGVACSTFVTDIVKPDVCKGLLDQYFNSVRILSF